MTVTNTPDISSSVGTLVQIDVERGTHSGQCTKHGKKEYVAASTWLIRKYQSETKHVSFYFLVQCGKCTKMHS